ncbi:very long chain fatty acid elongase AAEL008004-like isoform X1 [Linepithema humile]|uniref:very long chain fatty acid elongase AAEL008004-like isoform X1 n=1 Tax=Linepithema humile TaxID=83485 RepID=UPI00351E7D2B
MAEFTDLRTMRWALVPSPIPTLSIILVYLYIIYVSGPKFMKDRQPYSLKGFMQCYNVFQVIANFLIVFNIVVYGRPFTALWKYCDSFDQICGNNIEKQLEIIWWALLLKIIDLSETIVFILRKKYQQISALHVYHHISTVIYAWLCLRYFPHGFVTSILALNAWVHVIMYSYYFLSTCGLYMQQKLRPLKKWITTVQIIQIFFIMTSGLQGFTSTCNNKMAEYLGIVTFINGIPNIILFWNFYRNSYKTSKAI